MLVDIFSSFDDNNQVFSSMYMLMWGFSLSVVTLFNFFWLGSPRWFYLVNRFKEISASQAFRSLGMNMGGFLGMVSGLFLFLILMNLVGLIPYVFSMTSHLTISLSLGLPLWATLIASAIFNNFSSVIAGLLPMGAPGFLNPFLVIIETVSILVRPITLSVRLTANMGAGHIVIALISSYLSFMFTSSFIGLSFLLSVQILYTIFEFGISAIQAYIFCLLITLYSDEHPK
uniref:ATP synthase subunit a n=1 Tax=Coralliophila richardi TaxID=2991502 RepID=A0A9E8G9I7_9CAEN|nr:ATP synthase F0 subunit 6 [Coralliophila richardi]UZT26950.1 ATP synthase F0 subunit 6 [Coralliophila richardi]